MEASRSNTVNDPAPQRRLIELCQHALLSLIELTNRLSRSSDVHGVVDALLLNLMGQLGTARSAVWLRSLTHDDQPVLIRHHGIEPPLAAALAAACWVGLIEHFRHDPEPIAALEAPEGIGISTSTLVRRTGVTLFAPLRAGHELLGVVALGPRVGGKAYDALDIRVIEASLAMAGVALQNADLHGQALESNRRLRIANQELGELDRLKSEFIDNLSHELRTPITVLLGSLDCLKEYSPTAEQSRAIVGRCRESANTLLSLVEELLAFADARDETLAVNLVEVDLVTFLDVYQEQRRPGVSAGLRELHFVNNASRARAYFDEQRLREVLDRLLDNAVKFSAQGSNVWVSLCDHDEEGLPWLRIDVADDGLGISPQRLPEVFEEFRQLDGSLTREVGGLGLGLPMARKITEAMGGRITVSSEPGQGSVFSVLLPAA